MAQVLMAIARDGAGPGLVRVQGSFTTSSTNAVITTRPKVGNFTVTRKATGVYVVQFNQAGITVVRADCALGFAANVVGAGSVALATALPGYCTISSDFMTVDAANTHYAADATNTKMLVLVFNTAQNALTDVYTLSNSSTKPNLRLSFDYTISTSGMNS